MVPPASWGLLAMLAGGVLGALGILMETTSLAATGLSIVLLAGLLRSRFGSPTTSEASPDPRAGSLDLAPVGCWAWRLDDGTTWTDAKFRRLAGVEGDRESIPFAEFLGRVHPEDLSSVHASIDATIEGRAAIDLHARLRGDDGEWRPLRFVGDSTRDEEPDAGIRGVVLDDTHDAATTSLAEGTGEELVRTLSELARSNTELDEARRDLEVRNHELDRARIAAIDATRSKSEFLANMSHEIRTPLGAIIGHAELLAEEGDAIDGETEQPGRRREFVETIHRNGEHLLTLVSEILDLSKIEAGRMEIDRQPSDVDRIVEDVRRLFATQAARKGLDLEIHRDPLIPSLVSIDALRCRQVLINLIGNAIKFTTAGGIRIEIAYRPADTRLELAVIDTGIGIDESSAARIFQPFRQADGSTTRRFGGTGLGLSISRRLCRLMGGDLVLEREPGRGSRFTASLQAPPTADITGDSDPTVLPAGLRVLVAEDGPDNRRLIGHLLGRLGVTVEMVGDGRQALERIFEGGPMIDLVLMDMQMPVMDGWEATRRIRNAGLALPVVALTANAMPGDREACLEAGCDAYLPKPIRKEGLAAAVAGVVSRSEPRRRVG